MTYRDWRNQYTLGTISADHETITQAAYNAGWKDGHKRKPEFVGLTDEDMDCLFPHGSSVWVQETVKIIEAKLKEKNT